MKMKRILSILFALVMVCSLLPHTVFAANATFTLSASNSVIVGNQVNVTVKLSSAEKIGSWRFSVSYDPAILEYVSGADSGGGGAVSFANSSDGITSISKTISFRAKKIGATNVTVGSAQVVSFDSASNMTVNSPSRKITVVAAPNLSAENRLSELSVSAGELTPAFAADTAEYTVSVPYETTSVSVFATAKDAKASVAVTAIEELAVGENKIEVLVTAENGSKRTYVITVTRCESELAGVTVDLDGVTYQVAYDPAALTVPANYSPVTVEYGEKKILVFSAPRDTLKIAYLLSETSEGWYIFDPVSQSFSEYLAVTDTPYTLVLLTPPETAQIPEGFLPHSYVIRSKNCTVYKTENSEEEGIWLVYGMDAEGNCGFYYYDADLDTFFSYFEPVEDRSAEEALEKEKLNLQSLLTASEEKADKMEIYFLAAVIAAALLLIILIVSLVFLKKKKNSGGNDNPPALQEEKTPEVKEDAVPETKEDGEEASASEEADAPMESPEIPEFTPVDDAPKKRRAKRSIEDIVKHGEKVPSEPKEEFKIPEFIPDVTKKSPEPIRREEKKSDHDDIPPVLF